jgi:hypothetical protein
MGKGKKSMMKHAPKKMDEQEAGDAASQNNKQVSSENDDYTNTNDTDAPLQSYYGLCRRPMGCP